MNIKEGILLQGCSQAAENFEELCADGGGKNGRDNQHNRDMNGKKVFAENR